jgi:hypothetical protein
VTFEGLAVEDERDAGGSFITYFAIPPGREAAVARDLLACLNAGAEVCLRNDRDEGGEGTTTFRRTPAGLSAKEDGHGWQGDWRPVDEAGFAAAVAELAPNNRSGHWAKQGSLVRHKR